LKPIRIITLVFLSVILFGMTNKKTKKLPDQLIRINDSTFIDKYEITIQDYKNFLYDKLASTHNKHSIDTMLPNPNYVNWFDGHWTYNTIYEVSDSSISHHLVLWWKPIVNISKKQAEEYCEWRTKNWQRIYGKMPAKSKSKYYKDILFRLPDYQEWLAAASCGLDSSLYPTGKIKKARRNDFPVCLDYFTRAEKDSGMLMPQGGAEAWKYGIRNDKNIFNMCGDVAEFIRDKDFVAGGSFRDPLSQCRVSSWKVFEKPNDATGFRCVAVIK